MATYDSARITPQICAMIDVKTDIKFGSFTRLHIDCAQTILCKVTQI